MIAHFTGESFQITTRHYETLIDQAQKNLPKETGGFLGGHGRFIKGILPLFNSCSNYFALHVHWKLQDQHIFIFFSQSKSSALWDDVGETRAH